MFKKSKLFSLLALFSLLLLAFPIGVLGAESQTKQFSYTGGQQSWVVPSGVSSIKIDAYGAMGGRDTYGGGYGGYASGNLEVTAGQTLYFYVGGQGYGCVSGWGGGFNGGGNAGYNGCSGGGGGASDVRVGGMNLADRVIVAGGGGGGGQSRGGAGGGTTKLVGLGQGGHHPSDGGGGGGGYYGGSYGVSTSWWYGGSYASDTGGYGGSSFTGGVTNGTQTAGIGYGSGSIKLSFIISDITAPTGTIAYSTTTATNQDVLATLSTSELVTITNNGGSSTYNFENNGSFTFEFIDAAGNTGTAMATVTNIDKVAPTGTIVYSATTATNQDVLTTLSTSELVTITNNGGSSTYIFENNGSFTFEFIDAAGNTGTAVATVTNIDKIAPTGTIAYSTTTATNQDVLATLSTSELVTITNNGGSFTYIFENNGSFTFEFIDAAGNTGTAVATVTNIDKVAPTLSISVNNAVLKTPNHKLVPIVVTVIGNDTDGSGVASIILTSITSNENDNALGDGNTTEDIQGAEYGTSDTTFLLRAERSGNLTGRIYTITYTITDSAGNTNSTSTVVTVPKGGK